jgi:glycosyltransferase involved in cell wall biosynthesis
MKVVIATTIVPFIEGGAIFIVDWLDEMLRRAGHRVEVLKIPFHPCYPEMFDQMLALRLLDVAAYGDRLIAIRTPSYLLRHTNKVIWFIHHHRGAYDLWGTMYQDIPGTREGLRYRDAIFSADNMAFAESQKIFANSRVVAGRLKRFNAVDAEVLYPPLLDPERYRAESYSDYILYVSRLAHHKRQHLAIEALRYTRTPVRLILAGKADSETYGQQLLSSIEKYGLGDRVSILPDWISEEEKIKLFANCLGGLYIPYDEDSYGYPSLEAQHASKAVITTSDSGGPPELISDGENGFISAPDPKALAVAMDRLYDNRSLARSLGERGKERIAELGVTWDNVIAKLLS